MAAERGESIVCLPSKKTELFLGEAFAVKVLLSQSPRGLDFSAATSAFHSVSVIGKGGATPSCVSVALAEAAKNDWNWNFKFEHLQGQVLKTSHTQHVLYL